jgi:hypothetical protein
MNVLDNLLYSNKDCQVTLCDAVLAPVRVGFGYASKIKCVSKTHFEVTNNSNGIIARIACIVFSLIISPLCLIAIVFKELNVRNNAERNAINQQIKAWVTIINSQRPEDYDEYLTVYKAWNVIQSQLSQAQEKALHQNFKQFCSVYEENFREAKTLTSGYLAKRRELQRVEFEKETPESLENERVCYLRQMDAKHEYTEARKTFSRDDDLGCQNIRRVYSKKNVMWLDKARQFSADMDQRGFRIEQIAQWNVLKRDYQLLQEHPPFQAGYSEPHLERSRVFNELNKRLEVTFPFAQGDFSGNILEIATFSTFFKDQLLHIPQSREIALTDISRRELTELIQLTKTHDLPIEYKFQGISRLLRLAERYGFMSEPIRMLQNHKKDYLKKKTAFLEARRKLTLDITKNGYKSEQIDQWNALKSNCQQLREHPIVQAGYSKPDADLSRVFDELNKSLEVKFLFHQGDQGDFSGNILEIAEFSSFFKVQLAHIPPNREFSLTDMSRRELTELIQLTKTRYLAIDYQFQGIPRLLRLAERYGFMSEPIRMLQNHEKDYLKKKTIFLEAFLEASHKFILDITKNGYKSEQIDEWEGLKRQYHDMEEHDFFKMSYSQSPDEDIKIAWEELNALLTIQFQDKTGSLSVNILEIAAISEYFKVLLLGPFSEAALLRGRERKITLQDISNEQIRTLIHVETRKSLPEGFDPEKLPDLLALADRCGFRSAKLLIEGMLASAIDKKNLTSMQELAKNLKSTILSKACQEFVNQQQSPPRPSYTSTPTYQASSDWLSRMSGSSFAYTFTPI